MIDILVILLTICLFNIPLWGMLFDDDVFFDDLNFVGKIVIYTLMIPGFLFILSLIIIALPFILIGWVLTRRR